MEYIWGVRDGEKWWSTDPMLAGNLASMAGLTFIDKFHKGPEYISSVADTGTHNTVLYICGDSYTWSLKKEQFYGIAEYHFINRYIGAKIHLDTTKTNILVIEIAELWVRRYLRTLRMFDEIYDPEQAASSPTAQALPEPKMSVAQASFLPSFSIKDLFNKDINQNLQCNLFNYNFMRPALNYKAELNYYAFKRASGDVVISDDGNYLFQKRSVSLDDTESSYARLYPGETDLLVNNLNSIYDHYRAAGFKEVYLCMIPNTASLVQPNNYNNLVPLIQNDPRLKPKTIDVYYSFKPAEQWFCPGDTHWNSEGKQRWVNILNDIVRSYNK